MLVPVVKGFRLVPTLPHSDLRAALKVRYSTQPSPTFLLTVHRVLENVTRACLASNHQTRKSVQQDQLPGSTLLEPAGHAIDI